MAKRKVSTPWGGVLIGSSRPVYGPRGRYEYSQNIAEFMMGHPMVQQAIQMSQRDINPYSLPPEPEEEKKKKKKAQPVISERSLLKKYTPPVIGRSTLLPGTQEEGPFALA